MSLPPVEIPLGAMRFNSDSQKLEYFNGDVWMQIHTETAAPIGGRYLVGGGEISPADTNIISYVNTSTQGNAIDFGDLIRDQRHACALANNTRGIWAGGYKTGNSGSNVIDFVTIATAGNAADFGDIIQGSAQAWSLGSCASQTRGIFAGSVGETNIIQYVTMTSTGNATDFGDTLAVARDLIGLSSPTRGVFTGGSPANNDVIQYITIASEGNSVDFGNLTTSMGGANYNKPTGSNGVIGLFGPGAGINVEKITIATTGNAQEFASSDIYTTTNGYRSGSSDKIKMFIGPGRNGSGNGDATMETVVIATGGNAVDFGEATGAHQTAGSCCNAHGGLG
jgi:hypothetical protein